MTGRRQFGSIRKLPSGRWQARYPDGAGRLVPAPQTFATKRDASLFLAAVESDMARGTFIDPRAGRITFSVWCDQWLDRPGKRRNTLARDRQALAKYRATLGAMPLAAITPVHARNAVEAEAAKVAPATAARDFSALRAAFNAAVDAELLGRSPLRSVKPLRRRPPARPTLTPDELFLLVEQVDPRFRALILLAGVLGLRWSECIGMTVGQVDFLRRVVTIDRTISEVAGRLEADEVKSDAGRRSLAVPKFLVDALAAHLATHRPGAGPEDLVFVGRNGKVLRRSFAARHFRPAVRRAGLPDTLTFHGLRHVATTFMVTGNEHPRTVQHRLGHATADLSMELYAHVPDALDRAAADHLDALFSDPSGTRMARPDDGTAEDKA